MHKNICNSSHECSLKRKCWLLEWRIIFCMKMMIILLLWHWSMMTAVTMLKQCSEFTTWWVLNYDESAARVCPELSSNGHYCRVLQSAAEYCVVETIVRCLSIVSYHWQLSSQHWLLHDNHCFSETHVWSPVLLSPHTHSSLFHHHQWQMSL